MVRKLLTRVYLHLQNIRSHFVLLSIGDLPHECLLAFYESRRKWIFGGSGLTTRGIFVDGVHNCTNSHHYKAKRSFMDESLLSIAGVGASALNKTKINKMGDFKERLLFTNQPIIGYGSNDSVVSPISTAPDGSPVWSLSDESLPAALFDQNSGEFVDSAQARIRARLMINFGNPFKDKRGDSIVPQEFIKQRPPTQQSISEASSPQGSPPHSKFDLCPYILSCRLDPYSKILLFQPNFILKMHFLEWRVKKKLNCLG